MTPVADGALIDSFHLPIVDSGMNKRIRGYQLIAAITEAIATTGFDTSYARNDSAFYQYNGVEKFSHLLKSSADTVPDLTAVLAKGSAFRNNTSIVGNPGKIFQLIQTHTNEETTGQLKMGNGMLNLGVYNPDLSVMGFAATQGSASFSAATAEGNGPMVIVDTIFGEFLFINEGQQYGVGVAQGQIYLKINNKRVYLPNTLPAPGDVMKAVNDSTVIWDEVAGGGSSDGNGMYSGSDTLAGNTTVTGNGNDLSFDGNDLFEVANANTVSFAAGLASTMNMGASSVSFNYSWTNNSSMGINDNGFFASGYTMGSTFKNEFDVRYGFSRILAISPNKTTQFRMDSSKITLSPNDSLQLSVAPDVALSDTNMKVLMWHPGTKTIKSASQTPVVYDTTFFQLDSVGSAIHIRPRVKEYIIEITGGGVGDTLTYDVIRNTMGEDPVAGYVGSGEYVFIFSNPVLTVGKTTVEIISGRENLDGTTKIRCFTPGTTEVNIKTYLSGSLDESAVSLLTSEPEPVFLKVTTYL